jgi:CBS domain-containing protein
MPLHDHTANPPAAAGSQDAFRESVRKIAVFEVGPLLGERDRLIGIVTGRDIVDRAIVEGKQDGLGGMGWRKSTWVP